MARHHYPLIRQQYLAQKDEIKKQHIETLKAKQERKEKKEDRSRINKIAATNALVTHGGGVWALEDVEHKLENMTPQARTAALIVQIQYHRKVLNSKGNPQLFYKTSNSIPLSDEQLMANLNTILDINKVTTTNIQSNTLQYHACDDVTDNVARSKSGNLCY